MRKSRRSLYRPRKPTTEIPEVAAVVTRSTPWNGLGKLAKPGTCPRNIAACPFPGITRDPTRPVVTPVIVVSSKVTIWDELDGLASAIPVSMEPGCPDTPDDSAYKRNALAARRTG